MRLRNAASSGDGFVGMRACAACVRRLRETNIAPRRVAKHVQLSSIDGCEPASPADTFRATSQHFKARYGDGGEVAHLALQKTSSAALALDGRTEVRTHAGGGHDREECGHGLCGCGSRLADVPPFPHP